MVLNRVHYRNGQRGRDMTETVGVPLTPQFRPAISPTGRERETGDFLTVVGVVDDAGSLSVEPGFRVGYRERVARPELTQELLKTALVLEFRDTNRELLSHYPIPLAPLCSTPRSLAQEEHAEVAKASWMFAASVPFPPRTEYVRYFVGDELVRETSNPHTKLRVGFTRVPSERASDTEEISWRVIGAGDVPIRSLALLSVDKGTTWQVVTAPQVLTSVTVPVHFESLPGGTATLRVMVTDGFSTIEAESAPFEITTKGMRPTILSPHDQATVPADTEIHLVGQGYHFELGEFANDELVWSVSGLGEVGKGSLASIELGAGYHEISLTAGGNTASISVLARPSSTANLQDPSKPPPE